MNKTNIFVLFAIPFLLVACSKKSEVPSIVGYEKSTKVQVGPYQIHYGWHNEQTNSDNFVLLAEGNCNIFSRYSAGNDVYLDGLPFIHFERMSDGSLTNLQMSVWDAHHKQILLIDKNADGQWDTKLDFAEDKVFAWTNGQWIFRYQIQQTNQPASTNSLH